MIGVGINENVVVKSSTVDEKGKLVLTLDYAENLTKEKVDVFDQFSSAAVDDGNADRTLNIFPFKKPSGPKNETKTNEELLEMISDDMNKVRSQLSQLLEVYMKSDDIKWEPFRGTGIDKDNYRERFLNDDSLAAIFANYASQFSAMLAPFAAKPEFKLRMKLIRQSKDKHYATIPGRFLKENPWVESMDIPVEQSKVKFSKWELDNGYNDGTPVKKETADAPPEEKVSATESVFGQR